MSNTTPFPHHNTHSHCLQSSGDTPGLAQAALCPISGPDSCSFLLWDHLEDPNILILTLQCPSAGKQPHHSKPHQQLHSRGHSKAQKKTRELLGRGEPRPPHCLHGVLGWDLLPPAAWEQSPAPARSTRVTSVLSLLLHQTPEQSPCCGAAYTILQAPSSSVPSSPNTARNTGRENEHFGNNYCSTYPLPCKKEMQSHPQHLPWAGTQAPAFPSPPLWILGRKGEARTGVLASYNPTAALPSTAPTQGQLLMFRRINYSP